MAGNGPNPGACDRPYRRDRRGRSDWGLIRCFRDGFPMRTGELLRISPGFENDGRL